MGFLAQLMVIHLPRVFSCYRLQETIVFLCSIPSDFNHSISHNIILVSFQFLGLRWDWVHLVRRSLIGLLYQPRVIDDDECGALGGMRIDRRNRRTRRKTSPARVPLFPPQIPHELTWARTRVAAVGSRRLMAWAMARPAIILKSILLI
jgi:hypothetical protein